MRVWQVKVVREYKIQLEVETKVRGDNVQTVSGVAWDGWVVGASCAVEPGRQSPRGRKIGDKNK
jgi:hypothetical protein